MKVKICLIGKGIVGTSFLQLVKNKRDEFKQKFNLEIIVTSIFEHDGALIRDDGINVIEVLDADKDFRNLPYWKDHVNAKDLMPTLDANI